MCGASTVIVILRDELWKVPCALVYKAYGGSVPCWVFVSLDCAGGCVVYGLIDLFHLVYLQVYLYSIWKPICYHSIRDCR